MAPEQLADHILRALAGPTWHGPALEEVLEDVGAGEAAARPIAGAHSIWELVLHAAAWARISEARLAGEAPGEPSPEEDWPPLPEPTASSWTAAVDELRQSYRALAEAVRELDEARLAATLPGRDHPVWAMLHGVAEHAAYHGGQIVLLKKALRAAPPPP